MSKKDVIGKIDNLLKPLGFTQKKTTWNRGSGSVVEVIDAQVSKSGDTMTINAGVIDNGVYQELWGSEPPAFVEEPDCTVRERVGYLIGDKDLWWPLHDDQVGEKIAKAITDDVLPFVTRMRSRQEMVQWLTETQVMRKKYPPPIINLAILQHSLGKAPEACALLAELEKKAIGAWRARVAEVAARLGCAK